MKKTNNDIIIVQMEGEIDIYTVDQFRASIEKSIAESMRQEATEIILDCSGLTYIDSIGMGVLIEMRNRTQEMGQRIIMKNPRENIKKLMALTGVDRIIDIVESPSSGS